MTHWRQPDEPDPIGGLVAFGITGAFVIFLLLLAHSCARAQDRPLIAVIASSDPKEDCRESQYDGERDKGFVFLVVNKITETAPETVGPNNESGIIIFRLVFGGLLWVLLYAGLKSLGPL